MFCDGFGWSQCQRKIGFGIFDFFLGVETETWFCSFGPVFSADGDFWGFKWAMAGPESSERLQHMSFCIVPWGALSQTSQFTPLGRVPTATEIAFRTCLDKNGRHDMSAHPPQPGQAPRLEPGKTGSKSKTSKKNLCCRSQRRDCTPHSTPRLCRFKMPTMKRGIPQCPPQPFYFFAPPPPHAHAAGVVVRKSD